MPILPTGTLRLKEGKGLAWGLIPSSGGGAVRTKS